MRRDEATENVEPEWGPWHRISDTEYHRLKPHRIHGKVAWCSWQVAHTSPPEAALDDDMFPVLTSGSLKADGCMDWGVRNGGGSASMWAA
jgi:hypothetical protein